MQPSRRSRAAAAVHGHVNFYVTAHQVAASFAISELDELKSNAAVKRKTRCMMVETQYAFFAQKLPTLLQLKKS